MRSLILVTACALGSVAAPVPTDPRVYATRRANLWCGPKHETDALPGLDDAGCVKRFPRYFDRSFACPSTWPAASTVGFGPPARNLSAPIPQLDEHFLDGVIDGNLHAAVALVRRVEGASGSDRSGNTVVVRYLTNSHGRTPHQPWSSTKIFAAASASHALRTRSRGAVGLASTALPTALAHAPAPALAHAPAPGPAAPLRLGDLLTIVTSYDTLANLSSNQIGAYFQALGGHQAADDLVHSWLGAAAGESFGGDYGEAIPQVLRQTTEVRAVSESAHPGATAPAVQDPVPAAAISNQLSALTMAEFMRRIVHAREDETSQRAQASEDAGRWNMAWEDSEHILYGGWAQDPSLWGTAVQGLQWGGASMSSDVYLQRAVGIDGTNTSHIEQWAREQWRIFSKLGFGFSDERSQFELTLNGYGCFPTLASNGAAVPGRGLEFTLSLWAADRSSRDNGRALDAKFQQAVTNITTALLRAFGGISVSA